MQTQDNNKYKNHTPKKDIYCIFIELHVTVLYKKNEIYYFSIYALSHFVTMCSMTASSVP